jgi:RNA polymerase sigma-70 factor, ECF subfamily
VDDAIIDELALAGRDGGRDAFAELVTRLTRQLIALAYRYTGDWETARDLSQETWLRAWSHLAAWDQGRPFRPWLLAIHRNVCLSHLRRRARRPEHAAGDEELERLGPATAADAPLDALGDAEFWSRVRRATAELSPAQQLVFTRVDLEQAEQGAVARELGMQPATLRTTLHFARRRLARLLRNDEETP